MAKKTKKAMTINGQYLEDLIDGYTTLDVSGRESHSGSLKTLEKISDGNEWISRRYGGRTLTVSFVIEGKSNIELRHKLEKLSGIIDVKNARVIFDDESDKYFNVYLGENLSFSVILGVATGTFDLYCADPFKYDIEESVAKLETVTTYDGNTSNNVSILVAENDGYMTYPRFEASFGSDNGYILFAKTDNINFWNGVNARITAGNEYIINGSATAIYFSTTIDGSNKVVINPETDHNFRHVVDDDGVEQDIYLPEQTGYILADNPEDMSVVLANPKTASIYFGNQNEKNFVKPSLNTDSTDSSVPKPTWTINSNVEMVSDTYKNVSGATFNNSNGVVSGNDFKTITTKGFHGPVIVADIGNDQPSDFNLKWYHLFTLSSKKETGCVQVMLLDKNYKQVICYTVYNTNPKDQSGRVELYYKKELKVWGLTSASLGANGAYGRTKKDKKTKKSEIKKLENVISRNGKTITITSALDTTKPLVFEEETVSTIRYIAVYFGKYNNADDKSSDLTYASDNKLLGINFTSAEVDAENTFKMGDVLSVDCSDMSVKINGLSKPSLGDIGNDWLDMDLETGTNYITYQWSDWVGISPPSVSMFYRKRYI